MLYSCQHTGCFMNVEGGIFHGLLRMDSFSEWEQKNPAGSLSEYQDFIMGHFASDVQKLRELTPSRKMVVIKHPQGTPHLDFSYGDRDQWGGRFLQTISRTTRTCLSTVNMCEGGGDGESVLKHIENIQLLFMAEGFVSKPQWLSSDIYTKGKWDLLQKRFNNITQLFADMHHGIEILQQQYKEREGLKNLMSSVQKGQEALEKGLKQVIDVLKQENLVLSKF